MAEIAFIDMRDGKPPVTFDIFDDMIDAVALHMKSYGFSLGTRVGVWAHNSPHYVALVKGIIMAGYSSVLISPKVPHYPGLVTLDEAGVELTIYDPEAFINQLDYAVFPYEEDDVDREAIVLLTSGTTGEPKPVTISRDDWEKRVEKLCGIVTRGKYGRSVVASPLCHVSGLTNVEMNLRRNMTTILLEKFSVTKYVEALTKHGPSAITLTPTMARMIHGRITPTFPTVRYVTLSSEPVDEEVLEKVEEIFPKAEVFNSYGSTEIGPSLFGRHFHMKTPRLSVGYPRAYNNYDIRDGILYVQPNGIGDYLCTNDLFDRDRNGFYYFRGRADDVINVGGVKVYPIEIERVILRKPEVSACAVLGVDHDTLGSVPLAFVVGQASEREIKDHVQQNSSKHHVPFRVLMLDELPLNGNGKVDKAALRKMYHEG